jgi:hypothetical protein
MAKPKIFISSTYYDLKHIRSAIENFIDTLGYDSVLSEKGSIAYNPDLPLDKSCYREAENSDIFVIIIGGRYGSPISESDSINKDDFYERYESVTKMEYESALKKDIPLYILIEKSVKSEYETFKKNRTNTSIKYAHVDSINIFHFIDEIFQQNRNNPVKEFDKHNEIEDWLRIQWAGLFQELINNRNNQNEIASLTSQIFELSNLNKTLKRYMEELISETPNDKGKELIEKEEERLNSSRTLQALKKTEIVKDMTRNERMTIEEVVDIFKTSKTLKKMAEKYALIVKEDDKGKRLLDHWINHDNVLKLFKEVTDILGIPELKK